MHTVCIYKPEQPPAVAVATVAPAGWRQPPKRSHLAFPRPFVQERPVQEQLVSALEQVPVVAVAAELEQRPSPAAPRLLSAEAVAR